MTAQSKVLPGLIYTPTATPNVAKRGGRYLVRWTENHKRCRRTFGTYEAACAFRRDYVVPYRDGLVAVRPSTVDLSADVQCFALSADEVAHLRHLVVANDLYDPFGVRDGLAAKLTKQGDPREATR